jgi:hypothetical protein
MATERVADMTVRELKTLIELVVDQRMRMRTRPYRQQSDRPLSEILDEMRQIRIERGPGDPSVVEMIREDRDR